MYKLIFIIPLVFLTSILLAQEYAEFNTDTTRFIRFNGNIPNYISQQVWYFNGQEMKYGSGAIQIKADPNKLDTILYKKSSTHKFDTIICNVKHPRKYTFFFNACCGVFNIRNDSTKSFSKENIVFNISTKSINNASYLGKIGDTGVILKNNCSDTISDKCKSAMSPSVFNVSLAIVEPCKNHINCEGICELINSSSIWEKGWIKKVEIVNLLYLQLDDELFTITYSSKGTVKLN